MKAIKLVKDILRWAQAQPNLPQHLWLKERYEEEAAKQRRRGSPPTFDLPTYPGRG